jgi:Fe-S-cluster containining protein
MKKIFIPFLDGILDYDCQACGNDCCGAGNLVVSKKEKDILLKEYPLLDFFLDNTGDNVWTYRKYPDCWFLDDRAFCRIESGAGYFLKPIICRLHPFYISAGRNEYVVIPSGCKKLRVSDRNCKGRADHVSIISNARDAAALGLIQGNIEWLTEKVTLERRILKKCQKYLSHQSYLDFAACQYAITDSGITPFEARSRFYDRIMLWIRFLGLSNLILENGDVTYEMVALTPLLRAISPELRNMDDRKIPEVLLALYLCMLIFSQDSRVKRYVDTYLSVLTDIPLGLPLLNEGDIQIAHRSLRDKLYYVRTLSDIHKRASEGKRPEN